jgi:hypothetical protein
MEIDVTEMIWDFFEQHPMPDQPPGAASAACLMAATTRPNPLFMAKSSADSCRE